jgi:phosphoribosylaminoimidazole (AIR) synthetase
MKTTMLIAALVFAGARPVLACDYHATHTTAAESSTAVVCDGSGCHALETSTAQQQSTTEPTIVASQTDK